MIGPVQPFIESARTLRDLWSGSYLLSWLTAAAMRPIVDECQNEGLKTTEFVTPHLDAKNPLFAALTKARLGEYQSTLPSLPNKFAAIVPADKAESLCEKCEKAVRDEWRKISNDVKKWLTEHLPEQARSLDRIDPGGNWDGQIESFFEIRCVVGPALGGDEARKEGWNDKWKRLGAALDMARSVRHVPEYQLQPDDGLFPVKCSLLGTLEQMGPADLRESRKFWEAIQAPNWEGRDGTRLQTSDRLCAVSLVKRFAWPAYFAKTGASGESGRLGVDVRYLRFSDSATIAAARWLEEGEEKLEPYDKRKHLWVINPWSGQWLHWTDRNSDEDTPCKNTMIWDTIQRKKANQGKPPTYYAILHMDGDHMGELFEGKTLPDSEGKTGVELCRKITRRLTTFSLERVENIVQNEHHGELIYAGGDDLLAVLPANTAIACAAALRKEFSSETILGPNATASAGIAIVHYKEDLRFALEAARKAEKAAKGIGKKRPSACHCPERPKPKDDNAEATPRPLRKDALAITVCRHSGEHSTCVMGWDRAPAMQKLIRAFQGERGPAGAVRRPPASDRWAYKLRDELAVLMGLEEKAVETELKRLLRRTESAPEEFASTVTEFYDDHCNEMTGADRGWSSSRTLENFVTLCQTAAFLARGKD